MQYPVNTIFNSIQGEGTKTGEPMTFIRMQGCDVGCQFCDTKETWALDVINEMTLLKPYLSVDINRWLERCDLWVNFSASALVRFVRCWFHGPHWLLITGGEPALYALSELVDELKSFGYKVALETSGTEVGHLGADFDWVCVSPKLNMPGGKQIIPEVLEAADEIKMVVGKREHIEQLEGLLGWTNGAEICLQPISQSEKATQLCIDEVIKRGWRLSVQMHKYIGVK